MKRIIKITIITILSLCLVLVVWYCMPRTFAKGIDPADIDHISAFDGHTGSGFIIDDSEDIKYIVENLQSHPMKRNGLLSMGYAFSIEGVDAEGTSIIPILFINGDSEITKNPFKYTCDGGLCVDYLRKLESEYASTDIVTDDENNHIYFSADGAFVVNGTPYKATGKSYGEAICGQEVKCVSIIVNNQEITAWTPVYENTIGVFVDGEWKEYATENLM